MQREQSRAGADTEPCVWGCMSLIRGLHHLVVFCTDTSRSRSWYERVGFRLLESYDGMHWFELGGAQVMLHPGLSTGGSISPVVAYVAVDDLQALFAHVVHEGLHPYDNSAPDEPLDRPVTRPWGHVEFELRDPDGTRWGFLEG